MRSSILQAKPAPVFPVKRKETYLNAIIQQECHGLRGNLYVAEDKDALDLKFRYFQERPPVLLNHQPFRRLAEFRSLFG